MYEFASVKTALGNRKDTNDSIEQERTWWHEERLNGDLLCVFFNSH